MKIPMNGINIDACAANTETTMTAININKTIIITIKNINTNELIDNAPVKITYKLVTHTAKVLFTISLVDIIKFLRGMKILFILPAISRNILPAEDLTFENNFLVSTDTNFV